MARLRAAGRAARGARTAGADPRPARVLEPGVRRLARHADPPSRVGNADRGGRRGVRPPRAAATAAGPRHRHRLPAAGRAVRVPGRPRHRRGPLGRGRGAGRAQRRGAASGGSRAVRVRRLGGRAGRPVRPGPVQPALHPHRGPRRPDARGGAPRAAHRPGRRRRTDSRPIAGCFPRFRDCSPRKASRCWKSARARRRRPPDWRGRPVLQRGIAAGSGRNSARPRAPAGSCHEKTVWQRGAGSLASHPAGPAAPRLAPGALAVGRGTRRNQCRWIEARPRGHHPGRRRVVPRVPATSGPQLRRLDSINMNNETHAWTRPSTRWRRGWRRRRAATSRRAAEAATYRSTATTCSTAMVPISASAERRSSCSRNTSSSAATRPAAATG